METCSTNSVQYIIPIIAVIIGSILGGFISLWVQFKYHRKIEKEENEKKQKEEIDRINKELESLITENLTIIQNQRAVDEQYHYISLSRLYGFFLKNIIFLDIKENKVFFDKHLNHIYIIIRYNDSKESLDQLSKEDIMKIEQGLLSLKKIK